MTMHDGWTHEQEISWTRQGHEHTLARRLQLARIYTILVIVAVWLIQTGYVTYSAVTDSLILDDVEKFIGLIGVTGAVATILVMKLWPQNRED